MVYLNNLDDYLTSSGFPSDKPFRKGSVRANILRSASQWSTGNPITEHSILNAYYKLIDESKYYIILTNQFFISNTIEGNGQKAINK